MNVYNIIQKMRDAINTDAAILAWCQATYSVSKPTIYIGVDMDNPPGEDEYPLVVLFPASKDGGKGREDESGAIAIMTGVNDKDKVTQAQGDENLVEYFGISRVEAFRDLVLTAAAGADPDLNITDYDDDFEPVEEFPLFLNMTSLTARRNYVFRDSRIS